MASHPDSKLHVVMFPWFAFGHFIPYLHLSNELAMRGHRVSFLVPRGAEPKLRPQNLHPSLIHFFPLIIPPTDNLPPGAETASDLPFDDHGHLGAAFDETRDQVEAILTSLRPDVVLFDFAHWLPPFARRLGIKSVYYAVVSAAVQAICVNWNRRIDEGCAPDILQARVPPGCPSLSLPREAAKYTAHSRKEFGIGISFHGRFITSKRECDALSTRTCSEIEGCFCDYLAEQFSKPMFLTGPLLPEAVTGEELNPRWTEWLARFEPGSVVYCALGSQLTLKKGQFQELVLGFESTGVPFLAALKPPEGCSTVEEALPDGLEERVKGRGVVEGGWVQQQLILNHPAVGCFVTHCGFGSMWEALLSSNQIVTVPFLGDQIVNAALLAQEFKVAVEVERDEEKWEWSKESVCKAIKTVMDEDSEEGCIIKGNHTKLKEVISSTGFQKGYIDRFVMDLQELVH